MNTEHYKINDGEIVGHLFACFFKSLAMLRYGIMPLWVFDGTPPLIKQETIDVRKKVKEVAFTKLYSENVNLDDMKKTNLKRKLFQLRQNKLMK